MKEDFKEISIKLHWDKQNTSIIVSNLLKYVEKEEIKFKMEAKRGTILTNFFINVAEDIVAGGILLLIVWELEKRMRKARKKDKELPTPNILTDGESIGYEDFIKKHPLPVEVDVQRVVSSKRIPDFYTIKKILQNLSPEASKEDLEDFNKIIQAELRKRK